MNRFCIITNADKDPGYELAEQIAAFLKKEGRSCILIRDRFTSADIGKYAEIDEIPDETECIIVLGGDGTMIQASKDLYEKEIPILGVNLGTLGFLTEVEKQEIEEALRGLFTEHYKIEKRIMLEGFVEQDKFRSSALNDFVISKTGGLRLIELEVYVDDEFIDTYVADGLIISTPTGSTGYNLSAGGPVLAPEVKAMIITPICPHSLNKRSLVVDAGSQVEVRIGKTKENADDEAVVTSDGNEVLTLKTGDKIEIKRLDFDARIVKLEGFSFFKRMRQKLNRDA